MKNLLLILLVSILFISCNKEDAAPVPEGYQRGIILETMDAGGYTYMKLQEAEGESWVAAKEMKVNVGDTVIYNQNSMAMTDFHSKSLDRTFDKIIFADDCKKYVSTATNNNKPSSSGSSMSDGSMMGGSNPHKSLNLDKVDGIDVQPIPNGYTIADIYAKKDELNGKTVKVIGQIVKYNQAIMDRNWIHIQDGSGSSEDSNYDLVITSQEDFELGDIVSFEGVLSVNKDFGSGYKFTVIVENAKSLSKTKAVKQS